jgi:hypothetical protein
MALPRKLSVMQAVKLPGVNRSEKATSPNIAEALPCMKSPRSPDGIGDSESEKLPRNTPLQNTEKAFPCLLAMIVSVNPSGR